jgi:hypothetical protein
VQLINHCLGQAALDVAVALPVEIVFDDNAFRRPDDAVVGRQEPAGERLGIRVDQAGAPVEPLTVLGVIRSFGLKVIKLTGAEPGHEHAPDITPAVGFAIEGDDFGGFAVIDVIVQQHAHGRGRTTEYDELHAAVVQQCPVRQRVG